MSLLTDLTDLANLNSYLMIQVIISIFLLSHTHMKR